MAENLPAIPEPNEYEDFTVEVPLVEYRIKLSSGENLSCDLSNTTLYFFDGILEVMNHIYHLRDNGQPIYLFGAHKIMEEMVELDFDQYYSITPPSVTDLRIFFGWAREKMNLEAMRFLENQ